MNVTVRNVITSMRLISWFDWAQFVESVSLVDETLRDRNGFAEMDFATRDRYRHAIEEIARSSGTAELDGRPCRRGHGESSAGERRDAAEASAGALAPGSTRSAIRATT